MKIRIDGSEIPYPLGVLRGKLRLAGLSELQAAQAIHEIMPSEGLDQPLESSIQALTSKWLATNKLSSLKHFETLTAYEKARSNHNGPPPIIVVIEGASATGKSMIALELLQRLAGTRYISTDTVRQILRGMLPETSHPELHCHTYQAHKYKQEGPANLDRTVRGFIAQTNLIQPKILDLVSRILTEGALAVVEGVHLIPGSLNPLGPSVLEILVEPFSRIHEAMFHSKHSVGGLKSVSGDEKQRNVEFEAAQKIQEFMRARARSEGLPIVQFEDYDGALEEISSLVVKMSESLL